MAYYISQVRAGDLRTMAQVDALLAAEGLRRDRSLDYTCAMFDDDGQIAATGSCFGNTLRCFAVSRAHQGEGLLNEVISHLSAVQAERGNTHLFLYTKPDSAKFFRDLGFYEIARVEGVLVFMENRKTGFSGYLRALEGTRRPGSAAAVVMNANPFTLGHQYLAEQAAAACDTLHLFVVSEDKSEFPFRVRRQLVAAGTAHLPNVVLHDSGPYIISSATFPSYFLKDETAVVEGQARLDLTVFTRIAEALGLQARFVGDEPASPTTRIYNQVMASELPKAGIACHILPRKELGGVPISASRVRACRRAGDYETIARLVPPSTLAYLLETR